jgi:glycosyltransferase involved in cell wall biosynthesis
MRERSAAIEEGTAEPHGHWQAQRVSVPMRMVGERSRKLHILTVVRYPVGGIRTYLKYTYGRLDPTKYKFTIAATQFPESSLIPRDLSDFEVDLLETEEAAGNRGLLRSTREVLHHSPVDLIHSQGLTAGVVSILANWRWRRPHVITHHDVFRKDQFTGARGWLKRRLMAAVLGRADLIVCVTEDARRNYREFLPSFPPASRKLAVVPNGIDTKVFAEIASRRALAADAGRADSPFSFGFLGRFMPQKGFDVLVAAVAELARNGGPGRPFRIVTVSEGDCIGRYKAEVRRRGIERFIAFCGFTSSVADLLAELDCVVMPSRWESAGILAMEVLVAGCPLIATDCIGLREVVRDTPALVAAADDPASLAQQMKRAMDREGTLRAAFLDFAPLAGERFDVRRTAAAMESIFLGVMQGRKSAPNPLITCGSP